LMLPELGKTGRTIPATGSGTYYDPGWIAPAYVGWRRGMREKVEAIKAGLDSGITLVDTAEIYRSEPLVAKALEGKKRDEVFIASKVWSTHLHRDSLVKAFENSLKRLGTNYIDLYQVHWPNPGVPIEETMGAMELLVQEGKLMHIGVSNFNLEQMRAAQSALKKSELASVQLDYSLIHRNVESDILPYCDKERIALLAYYPLGHGKLPKDGRLDSAAKSTGNTRAQVALQWLAGKANVFPIPRASVARHVRENAGGSDWELPDLVRKGLDSAFG